MKRVVCIFVAVLSLAWTPAQLDAMHAAVDAVCPLIEQQAAIRQAIRLEQQNPARVVDLRYLHELGAALQFTRAELSRERAEHRGGLRLFVRFAGKAPDLGFCLAHDRQAHPDE